MVFRILDYDIHNLKKSDQILNRLVRNYNLNAKVIQVSEVLEFGRLGIADKLPALELNGVIMCTKCDLTEKFLEDIIEKIIARQRKSE